MKKLLLLLAIATVSCAQQVLYSHVSWEHPYTDEIGRAIDSTDLEFVLFISATGDSGTFEEYVRTNELSYYTLQDINLYSDDFWWWYSRAYWISQSSYSNPSDTISAFYRKIKAGKTYNMQVLKLER